MPRVLYEKELTFESLVKAYFDCRKRKRNTINALRFEFNLEENLYDLYQELISGTYEIGRSICFMVLEPKPREVWAADFRDRIVHHLIYNAISPIFYDKFIENSFSCIPNRGTLSAFEKINSYARSITNNYQETAYYMKADIQNFFVSINRDILYAELEKYIKVPWLLSLISQVIYNDCKKNCIVQSPQWKFEMLPPQKSLWHTPEKKGLPIGNLTSQFFSNVYLNILDQYVKNHWHCKYYCRYVDDFIILDKNPKLLNQIHKDLTRFLLTRLDLNLHQKKKSINKIEKGIDFVGFNAKPYRVLLRQRTLKRIFRKIEIYKNSSDWYSEERVEDFLRTINSYLGMLRNTDGYKMRRIICIQCINLFLSCDEDFTKLINNYKKPFDI